MKLFDTRTDRDRTRLEWQEAVRPDHPIPVDTRRYLLEGRNGLIYLPSHGKYGGIISRISKEIGVSRQYTQTILFPDNVGDLFGNGVTSRFIWAETAKAVYGHHLYDKMRMAFETLERGDTLILRAAAPLITFFLKRAGNIGLPAIVTDREDTTPITYEIRLSSVVAR